MAKSESVQQEKVCFVISPIGLDGSPIRQHSDSVLQNIIQPAAERCGYKAIRGDQMPHPTLISIDIVQQILDAPVVIAILTGQNANVFYELALRHAVRKPVIHIIEAGQVIPFDVNQSRTIEYRLDDIAVARNCENAIVNQIRTIEANPQDFYNPISLAVDIQILQQSKDPIAQTNAETISMFQEIIAQLKLLSRVIVARESIVQNELEIKEVFKKLLSNETLSSEQRARLVPLFANLDPASLSTGMYLSSLLRKYKTDFEVDNKNDTNEQD